MPTLSCSCCGNDYVVTEEEYRQCADDESGWCLSCGGDPELKGEITDQYDRDVETYGRFGVTRTVARKEGFAGLMFFGTRCETLEKALKPDQLEHFMAMTWDKKKNAIGRLIKKGAMI